MILRFIFALVVGWHNVYSRWSWHTLNACLIKCSRYCVFVHNLSADWARIDGRRRRWEEDLTKKSVKRCGCGQSSSVFLFLTWVLEATHHVHSRFEYEMLSNTLWTAALLMDLNRKRWPTYTIIKIMMRLKRRQPCTVCTLAAAA